MYTINRCIQYIRRQLQWHCSSPSTALQTVLGLTPVWVTQMLHFSFIFTTHHKTFQGCKKVLFSFSFNIKSFFFFFLLLNLLIVLSIKWQKIVKNTNRELKKPHWVCYHISNRSWNREMLCHFLQSDRLWWLTNWLINRWFQASIILLGTFRYPYDWDSSYTWTQPV